MLRFFPLLIFCTLSLSLAQGQNKLEQVLDQLMQDPSLRHGSLGFCLLDLEQNSVIAQRSAQLSLIPASTLKILSTGAALGILGPDYRYLTQLHYQGELDATGVLRGNIYLKGSGDPSLGSPYLPASRSASQLIKDWADAIEKAGIRRIEGAIIADLSCFERNALSPHWQVGDLGHYYGAGAFGLNFHDNFFRISLQRGRQGTAVKIMGQNPDLMELKIDNALNNGPSNAGKNTDFYAYPYLEELRLEGEIPAGKGLIELSGAIPNPPLFAVQSLEQALKNRGIFCSQAAKYSHNPTETSLTVKILHLHRSPRLWDLVQHINFESRNHYCEALVRTLALERRGQGKLSLGLEVLQQFWQGRGIDMSGCFIHDGSGLSGRNGLTPLALCQILRDLSLDPKTFPDFAATLPLAGQQGTMKNVAKGSAAQERLRAKTGTLGRIRSYAGYVETRTGRKLAFAILVNNYLGPYSKMKERLNGLLAALVEVE